MPPTQTGGDDAIETPDTQVRDEKISVDTAASLPFMVLKRLGGSAEEIKIYYGPQVPAVVAGRGPGVYIDLQDKSRPDNMQRVSALHAVFVSKASGIYMVDTNSSKGAFVNGEQLRKYPHKPPFPTPPGNKYLFPLEAGDEINFGGFEVGLGPLGTLGTPKEVNTGSKFVVMAGEGVCGNGVRSNQRAFKAMTAPPEQPRSMKRKVDDLSSNGSFQSPRHAAGAAQAKKRRQQARATGDDRWYGAIDKGQGKGKGMGKGKSTRKKKGRPKNQMHQIQNKRHIVVSMGKGRGKGKGKGNERAFKSSTITIGSTK